MPLSLAGVELKFMVIMHSFELIEFYGSVIVNQSFLYIGTKFFPQLLLSATLPLVDLKQCRRNLQQLGSIVTNENICAGGLSSDSCVVQIQFRNSLFGGVNQILVQYSTFLQGDSGGPLMVANSSSNSNTTIRYSQLGITSWGVGCAEKGIPAVYTRVESHLPWIQRITRKDSCVPAAPNISQP